MIDDRYVTTKNKTILKTWSAFSKDKKEKDLIIITLTFKELKQFYKTAEKRQKMFSKEKKFSIYYNHLSPDVTFLMRIK